MTNARRKQFKMPKQVPPRAMDAINQDYGRVVSELGQAEYLVHVYTTDAQRKKEQLLSLNREAQARQELDKKNADATITTPPSAQQEEGASASGQQ